MDASNKKIHITIYLLFALIVISNGLFFFIGNRTTNLVNIIQFVINFILLLMLFISSFFIIKNNRALLIKIEGLILDISLQKNREEEML